MENAVLAILVLIYIHILILWEIMDIVSLVVTDSTCQMQEEVAKAVSVVVKNVMVVQLIIVSLALLVILRLEEQLAVHVIALVDNALA